MVPSCAGWGFRLETPGFGLPARRRGREISAQGRPLVRLRPDHQAFLLVVQNVAHNAASQGGPVRPAYDSFSNLQLRLAAVQMGSNAISGCR